MSCQRIGMYGHPTLAGVKETNLENNDQDVVLEKMLLEAGRLALQMRSVSLGEHSSQGWNSSVVEGSVPDTIDTNDNQTECSSIGISHALGENTKWVPPYGPVHEEKIDLTTTEESSGDDGSDGLDDPKINGNITERLSTIRKARETKRNIEELVMMTKACVRLEDNIRCVVSQVGESAVGATVDSSNDLPSNEESKSTKDDDNLSCRASVGTLGTLYHDASCTALADEAKCGDISEHCTSRKAKDHSLKTNPLSKTIELADEDRSHGTEDPSIDVAAIKSSSYSATSPSRQENVLKAAEEVERALKALGESSRNLFVNLGTGRSFSELPYLQPVEAAIGSLSGLSDVTEKPEGSLQCGLLPKYPRNAASWNNYFGVSRQDDDYVSIADYCGSKKVRHNIITDHGKMRSDNGAVKWEKMSTAEAGDDDFVPIQDYSLTSAQKQFVSEMYEHEEQINIAYNNLRARRRKKKLRRRAFVVLSLMLAVSILYVYRDFSWSGLILNISSKFSPSDNVNVTVVQTEENDLDAQSEIIVTPQKDMMYFAEKETCSVECISFFGDDKYNNLPIPYECFGMSSENNAIQLVEPALVKSAIPKICLIPFSEIFLQFCRQAKRDHVSREVDDHVTSAL